MKYIFYGNPNTTVTMRKKNYFNDGLAFSRVATFDDKGEFITDNPMLIRKMKARFDHKPILEENNVITPKEEIKAPELDIEVDISVDSLSYNELRKLAKEKGIDLGKTPKKDELIKALEG
jgi:hypothetical protein